ncbi:hypothetical protein GQ42DRAFT_159516 [Ramicandelaber brevisporus]|nr:hypothetical protein GQ42DRAFT_159516 [Ramicandelaber brevisporus]
MEATTTSISNNDITSALSSFTPVPPPPLPGIPASALPISPPTTALSNNGGSSNSSLPSLPSTKAEKPVVTAPPVEGSSTGIKPVIVAINVVSLLWCLFVGTIVVVTCRRYPDIGRRVSFRISGWIAFVDAILSLVRILNCFDVVMVQLGNSLLHLVYWLQASSTMTFTFLTVCVGINLHMTILLASRPQSPQQPQQLQKHTRLSSNHSHPSATTSTTLAAKLNANTISANPSPEYQPGNDTGGSDMFFYQPPKLAQMLTKWYVPVSFVLGFGLTLPLNFIYSDLSWVPGASVYHVSLSQHDKTMVLWGFEYVWMLAGIVYCSVVIILSLFKVANVASQTQYVRLVMERVEQEQQEQEQQEQEQQEQSPQEQSQLEQVGDGFTKSVAIAQSPVDEDAVCIEPAADPSATKPSETSPPKKSSSIDDRFLEDRRRTRQVVMFALWRIAMYPVIPLLVQPWIIIANMVPGQRWIFQLFYVMTSLNGTLNGVLIDRNVSYTFPVEKAICDHQDTANSNNHRRSKSATFAANDKYKIDALDSFNELIPSAAMKTMRHTTVDDWLPVVTAANKQPRKSGADELHGIERMMYPSSSTTNTAASAASIAARGSTTGKQSTTATMVSDASGSTKRKSCDTEFELRRMSIIELFSGNESDRGSDCSRDLEVIRNNIDRDDFITLADLPVTSSDQVSKPIRTTSPPAAPPPSTSPSSWTKTLLPSAPRQGGSAYNTVRTLRSNTLKHFDNI